MIRLDLEVNNRGDAALKQAASGLDGVGKSAHNADRELKELTKSQQNAAMRMMRMHEEAIRMNQGFSSTNDKAQRFSATLSQVSSTATASAAAFGLPIGQLNALNAAADLAGLSLTKTAAGFNAASVGVVGAGLAIGAAIGTLLRQIPAVAKAADAAAESLFRLFGAGFGADTSRIAGGADIAAKRTVDTLRAQGKSLEEIKKLYKEMPPAMDAYITTLEKGTKAQKTAAETADQNAKILAEVNAQLAEQQQSALIQGLNAYIQNYGELKQREEDIEKHLWEEKKKLWKDTADAQKKAYDTMVKAVQEHAEEVEAALRREREAHEEHQRALVDLYGEIADTLLMLGASGSNALVQIAIGMEQGTAAAMEFQRATNGAAKAVAVLHAAQAAFSSKSVFGGAAAGASFGAQFGPIGALIGAGAGGLLGGLGGIFGKQKEHMRVNDMRDAFLSAQGGFIELQKKLKEITDEDLVKKVFDAKTVKEFEAAVGEVNRMLGLQETAQKKLQEAMDRYGLTISEMGPKFAQQELDKQAMQLFEDWELLNAAGADHNAVLEKMAPTMNEYIQQALAAGATIPENLRPIIEEMIRLGLLTDEAGNKFETLDDAGIKFGASLDTVVEGLKELVEVLKRIYGITSSPPGGPPPATVNGGPADTEPPQLASGGYVTSSGLAYLHAGETVVPSVADWQAPLPPGALPPGTSGWTFLGGGGGAVGGPAGSPTQMMTATRPQVINVTAPFAPVLSGVGNQTEMARLMVSIARENREGFRTVIEQISRGARRV